MDGNAVPSSWITDNILFWPKNKIEREKRRKLCLPAVGNCDQYICKILMDNLGNLAEAIGKEKEAEMLSDSDQPNEVVSFHEKAPRPDFNSMLESINTGQEVNSFSELIYEVIDAEQEVASTFTTTSDIITKQLEDLQKELKQTKQELQNELRQQHEERIKFEAEVKTAMDLILKKIENTQYDASCVEEDDAEEQYFPIENVTSFETFENRLHQDEYFRKKLLRKLMTFGGNNGEKTLRILCVFLFNDCLLEKFSWTGTTNKPSLVNNYKETVKLLFSAVRKAFPLPIKKVLISLRSTSSMPNIVY